MTVQYRLMYSYAMDRVTTEKLRRDLAHWLREARKRRVIVTSRGYDHAGLCPMADIRLLEALEKAGQLEELRRSIGD